MAGLNPLIISNRPYFSPGVNTVFCEHFQMTWTQRQNISAYGKHCLPGCRLWCVIGRSLKTQLALREGPVADLSAGLQLKSLFDNEALTHFTTRGNKRRYFECCTCFSPRTQLSLVFERANKRSTGEVVQLSGGGGGLAATLFDSVELTWRLEDFTHSTANVWLKAL